MLYLSMIDFPTGVEPVKPTFRTSGCPVMRLPTTEPEREYMIDVRGGCSSYGNHSIPMLCSNAWPLKYCWYSNLY